MCVPSLLFTLPPHVQKRGDACEGCLEKSELVGMAADGDSSAASCSICCEDYESGGC